MKDFHRATIGAASAIAKRGQQSSQNLDIMGTILAMMKKTKSENEATSLLLVRLLCAVATFSTLAPVGKFYPDTFIRGLCEESLSQKPKARELVLQAFQTIAKVSEEEKAKYNFTRYLYTLDHNKTRQIKMLPNPLLHWARNKLKTSMFTCSVIACNWVTISHPIMLPFSKLLFASWINTRAEIWNTLCHWCSA